MSFKKTNDNIFMLDLITFKKKKNCYISLLETIIYSYI